MADRTRSETRTSPPPEASALPDAAEIGALLPLAPPAFQVLLALADQERHGYAILQEVEQRTAGSLKLSATSLYRSIHRMLQDGLIAELRQGERPAPAEDDERRRYYRITPLGLAVARAEVHRLSQLVAMAGAKGLAPGRA
jgi:DNA-binding PadR family transcriptional regulator